MINDNYGEPLSTFCVWRTAVNREKGFSFLWRLKPEFFREETEDGRGAMDARVGIITKFKGKSKKTKSTCIDIDLRWESRTS